VGDILSDDVSIRGFPLFDRGTVLNSQRIEVLHVLRVETVSIESRVDPAAEPLDESLRKLDERFGYVDGAPFMMTLKSWMKDILIGMEKSDA